MKELLSVCDIFIHSSKGEGCSNAILEAMASDLPVLATNVGGIPEITSSESAILFDYKDAQQLINSILRLIQDEILRKQMSVSAKTTALERFSMNAMMINYREIINEIAG